MHYKTLEEEIKKAWKDINEYSLYVLLSLAFFLYLH